MNNSFAVQSRLDAKQRLIKAGLEIFGTFNLGATTRQLAQRAGVNQAAIPYYFGGKEGHYLALIEHLITHKASRVRAVLLQISELLEQKRLTPEEAVNQIKTLFWCLPPGLLDDKAATTWARILMREQIQPTKAFHLLYERWIRHVQRNACRSLGGHSAKKKANRSERDFTNTYISWADSDFSFGSRNDSASRELGRLRRKREEADSEGRLRSTGFVFAASDPTGSLILEDVANQGVDLPNIGVFDAN